MIVSYSLENFKSYRDKKQMCFFATNSKAKKRYPENYITQSGVDVYKTALIVGENAGGKTSLVSSLSFLRSMLNTVDEQVKSYRNLCFYGSFEDDQPVSSFIEKTRQSFCLEVLGSDNQLYKYSLTVDAAGVEYERLSVRQSFKKSEICIFELRGSEIEEIGEQQIQRKYNLTINSKYDNDKVIGNSDFINNREKNGLFVKVLSLLGVKEATVFMEWINKSLSVNFERLPLDLYYRIKNKDSYDDSMISTLKKKEFFDIFCLVDSSIRGIEVDEEKPFEDTLIIREIGEMKVSNKLSGDSSGVKQFFALAYEVYKVIFEGKVLVADEYDSFLNPILTQRLISYINSFDGHGQFIFTTHNVTHLNLQTFMKEQMFVVTKSKSTLESDLYSLREFKDLRYDSNQKIYEFYLKGLLGGVGNYE